MHLVAVPPAERARELQREKTIAVRHVTSLSKNRTFSPPPHTPEIAPENLISNGHRSTLLVSFCGRQIQVQEHQRLIRAAMNTPPSPPHTFAPANDGPLVLGPSVVLNGSMELSGELVIHGRVEGQVRADRVLIAQSARVSGILIASEVTIDGEADDILIFAAKIMLRDGSYVTGEIWHKELLLEAGHLFEGKSRRHIDPQALASSMTNSPVIKTPIEAAVDSAETDT